MVSIIFCLYPMTLLLDANTGVFLTLNADVIPNHGYMKISDIGTDTALLCHTDHPPLSNSHHSGGDWFGPDGTRVNGADVPGFITDRGSMVVRLKRTTGIPAQGIYWCSILDSASTLQTIYVGLFNSGRGIIINNITVLLCVKTSTFSQDMLHCLVV